MTSLARGALAGLKGLSELIPAGARTVAAQSVKEPALAAATGLFLADVSAPLGRSVNPAAGVKKEKLRAAQEERRFYRSEQLKAERLKGAVEENIRRIAATNPHLYNQLLRQRRLPRGAVVIGGQPRPDFLEEVAFEMATGGMQKPQDQQRDIISELASGSQ